MIFDDWMADQFTKKKLKNDTVSPVSTFAIATKTLASVSFFNKFIVIITFKI